MRDRMDSILLLDVEQLMALEVAVEEEDGAGAGAAQLEAKLWRSACQPRRRAHLLSASVR